MSRLLEAVRLDGRDAERSEHIEFLKFARSRGYTLATDDPGPTPPGLKELLERIISSTERGKDSGSSSAIDEALSGWHGLLESPGFAAAPISFRVEALDQVAVMMLGLAETSQQARLFREAVRILDTLADTLPEDSPEIVRVLCNRAVARTVEFQLTSDLSSIERALSDYDLALAESALAFG